MGFLDVRSVKAYYDGALGSRGARLLEDYSDQPGHRGVSGDGYGYDASVVDGLVSAGFQVGVHAIGDAGNREVLNYFESAQMKFPASSTLRHRIEHAQVIANNDFQRFRQLNLIASMEPPHAVEDKTWAEDRLGAERIKGAYAWRTLRREGVDLTFNSDLPGSDHSIFYALHAAGHSARQTSDADRRLVSRRKALASKKPFAPIQIGLPIQRSVKKTQAY